MIYRLPYLFFLIAVLTSLVYQVTWHQYLSLKLFNTYRQVIRAHVPARLNRVVREVPEDCDDIRCATLQRAIIHTALQDREAAEELNELDLRIPTNRERIQAQYQNLLDAFEG